jgi:hypothetical protein
MTMESQLNTQMGRTTWKMSHQTPEVAVWPVIVPTNQEHQYTISEQKFHFFLFAENPSTNKISEYYFKRYLPLMLSPQKFAQPL